MQAKSLVIVFTNQSIFIDITSGCHLCSEHKRVNARPWENGIVLSFTNGGKAFLPNKPKYHQTIC